jgi:hypothetical protein
MNLRAHVRGERVYYRDADAVEAAGNFVAFAAEFSAGVKHGHDRLERGDFGFWMDFYRNAAAVIGAANAPVRHK